MRHLRGYTAAEKLAFWSWPMPSGCIVWVAGTDGHGYGVMRCDGRILRVHRAACEIAHGPIPSGYEPDHLCRNTLCVNPEHIEAVPKRVNILRGFGPPARFARRTHCKHGHEFSGENLLLAKDRRVCLACRREREMERGGVHARGGGGLAWRALLTHCVRGHAFDEANTYWRRGGRQCRACGNERGRDYRQRRAA